MEASCGTMKETKENIVNEAKAEIWKKKYEECEKTLERVKMLSKKVVCDFEELQRKYQENLKQHDRLKEEYRKKEQTLEKFQTLSADVVEEYDTLHAKYEIESQAKDEVMEKASKWYHENRALKRKSTMLMQKVMGMNNVDLAELADIEAAEIELQKGIDHQDTVEHFNQTINKLKDEIVAIRKELRGLQEEKMTLANERDELTKLYQAEKSDHETAKEKLKFYETTLNQMNRVSVLAVQEFDDLYSRCVQETEKAKQLSEQVVILSRERDALAEKNAMLLEGTLHDDKLSDAVNEIEELKRQLQEKQDQHTEEIEKLKNQVQVEISDELTSPLQKKIDCLEKCLEEAEERAFTAERKIETLQQQVREMECQLERRQAGVSMAPPPPPPLPPPLPPAPKNPLRSLIALIGAKKKLSPTAVKKKKLSDVPDDHQKAMMEMVESIKRGDVKLKPVRRGAKVPYENDASQTAIDEMRNILNSLKKQTENGDENSRLPSMTSMEQEGELFRVFEQKRKISGSSGKAVSTSSSSQDISSEDGDEEVRKTSVRMSLMKIVSDEDMSEGSCKQSSDSESVNSKEDSMSKSAVKEESTASIDSISEDSEAVNGKEDLTSKSAIKEESAAATDSTSKVNEVVNAVIVEHDENSTSREQFI